MKSIILLATLVSTSAFASSSYIYHDFDGALRGIALSNACVTQDEVRTINPMKVCTKYSSKSVKVDDHVFIETVCVASEVQSLAFSRKFNKSVCTKLSTELDGGGCDIYGSVEVTLPDSILVATVTANAEENNLPGVSRQFTFPACK